MRDWSDNRRSKQLDRSISRLDELLRPPPGERDQMVVAELYGGVLLDALRMTPAEATAVFARFDARLTSEERLRAFSKSDEPALARLVESGDVESRLILLEIAVRTPLPKVRDRVIALLLPELARGADVHRLVEVVGRLSRWGLLTADRLASAVEIYLQHATLDHDREAWTAFFDAIPDLHVPRLFDVAVFLGRGAEAANLADSRGRRTAALQVCLRSGEVPDLEAGLRLADELGDAAVLRRCAEALAEALVQAGRVDEAIDHFAAAGRADKVSDCYEQQGRLTEALAACPPDDLERIAGLCERALQQVDALVEHGDFSRAAELVAAAHTVAVPESPIRAAVDAVAAAVQQAGREHFAGRRTGSDPGQDRDVLLEWSDFEDRLGEPGEAARLAALAGDRYRAHRLYRKAGLFGHAVQVLAADHSPAAATARAEASAAGGDLRGAAAAHRAAGMLDDAARCYQEAGDMAAAARCRRELLGDDAAESADYARCARAAGLYAELVEACTTAIDRRGRRSAAMRHLRELLRASADALDPATAERARQALTTALESGRDDFDRRATAWVRRARDEVDRRFADIWGFDLGTTTCVAAIYDTTANRPVVCPWAGRDQFPSTISVDKDGTEIVGLAGEDTLRPGLVGLIARSKRQIGTRTAFRIRERQYSSEEVAARLISHGRNLVEGFLTGHVRERVRELAQAELGEEVPDEWIDGLQRAHSLQLSRPRVVITVPAYFSNNQKNATRDAGEIAGVTVVRLLHEPTAACLAVHRQRPLQEQVVVVDLGAGTLDLSNVEVTDNVYEVKTVDGDTGLGGADFDRVVQGALEEQADRAGATVTSSLRRRIAVAAEQLRIRLSSQEHAEYMLRGLGGGSDLTLTLSRQELTDLLSEAFGRLGAACERFRRSLHSAGPATTSLVLVGGPFLSPATRKVAEDALGMTAVGVTDPASVVAHGAALQGAVLSGDLREVLLLDVTPLPLGIRVVGAEKDGTFAELIAANTTIPTTRRETFTTAHDNQASVHIDVLQGSVTTDARIGQFSLDNIPPAPQGEPQIEVAFSIDANCVLEVTARNVQTGATNSVRITDTTLLRPQERQHMTEVLQRRRRREATRSRLRELLAQIDRLAGDSDALLNEWRTRLSAHRATAADPDRRVRELFTAMYRDGNDVEAELTHLELTLRDLAAHGHTLIERPIDDSPGEDEEILVDRLDSEERRHRELQDTVGRWNAVLVAAVGSADPRADFVRWHDADNHVRALDALAQWEPAGREPELVRRQLDCLAHLGEHEAYATVLRRHADELALPDVPVGHPERFLESVLPAVVRSDDGTTSVALGFVWSPDLVVVADRPGDDGSIGARGLALAGGQSLVFAPTGRRHRGLVAIPLQTAVPVTAVRAGYGRLLRIGDAVFVLALQPDGPILVAGVVQRLDPSSGRAEVSVDSDVTGLTFNTLGEIVGLSTPDPASSAQRSTLTLTTLDALPDLIASTGCNPWTG
jgi:molecular chaperone DnaK